MHADGGTLIIRTDAGTEFGTGHVMRCLALAEAWRDAGGTPRFVSVDVPPAIRQRVLGSGFELESPSVKRGTLADASATIRSAHHHTATWIAADGYLYDVDWQRRVRSAGLKLLVVDDYGHLPAYDADLLLNQNVGVTQATYRTIPLATQCLFENQYALLRREFLELDRHVRRDVASANRVLVTLGGGDPDNVTARVLAALAELDRMDLDVVALVGGANRQAKQLQALADTVAYRLRVEINSREPGRHMQWADLAISAGGSTTWELAYLGVPTCHIVIAENQIEIARHTQRRGFTESLGWFEDLETSRLSHTVSQLLDDPQRRASMSCAGQNMIDGRGAARVVDAMLRNQERTECVSRAS